jgi:hypothetical protein
MSGEKKENRVLDRRVLLFATIFVLALIILVVAIDFQPSLPESTSSESSTNESSLSSIATGTAKTGETESASSSSSSPTLTNSTSTVTANSSVTDYSFFIQGNVVRIEALRQWFMSPMNVSTNKAGYDPSYGMIRGGFWDGGFQNGFVLIDSQLIVANTLDYLNSQGGVTTDIEGNMRQWLTSQFIDPATGQTSTYNGEDRREILFGKNTSCVMGDSGQVFYVPGHTISDAVPITTALPTTCVGDGLSAMNTYAPAIELAYIQGNVSGAVAMFLNTVAGWTPTPGTGINGTTGGYFSDTFDSGPDQGKCKSSRTLGYWIEMARATGFWDLDATTITVAQEVMDELWAHQQADGGIMVNYPGCKSQLKDSVESSGITLVAFDPRVPSWFGHNSSAALSTSSVTSDQSNLTAYVRLTKSLGSTAEDSAIINCVFGKFPTFYPLQSNSLTVPSGIVVSQNIAPVNFVPFRLAPRRSAS